MQALDEQVYKRSLCHAATGLNEEECKAHNEMVNAMMEGIAEMQRICRAAAEALSSVLEEDVAQD